jgi:hypothetical protein
LISFSHMTATWGGVAWGWGGARVKRFESEVARLCGALA